jgi:hypothetical protein
MGLVSVKQQKYRGSPIFHFCAGSRHIAEQRHSQMVLKDAASYEHFATPVAPNIIKA